MPPEAEENGTHTHEVREENCSLQRMRCSTQSECTRMLIAAGGRTMSSTEHREKKKKKVGFPLFENTNSSFGNSFSNLDFLITTKNSGGLAAMIFGLEFSQ